MSKTNIKILNNNYVFETIEEEMIFDGWKVMYKSEEKPKFDINCGDILEYKEVIGKEKFTISPKSHYTEASLIKHMDEIGSWKTKYFMQQ